MTRKVRVAAISKTRLDRCLNLRVFCIFFLPLKDVFNKLWIEISQLLKLNHISKLQNMQINREFSNK